MDDSPGPSSLKAPPSVLTRFLAEIGLPTLFHSALDVKLLILQRFIRLFAFGASTLILALYLSALGHSETRIGLFMTLTLFGDLGISFLLTLVADGLGRRKILALGAVLLSCSGVVFATVENYWLLLAAAILGVISPAGNEIGPFRAIEESTLAHLTQYANRADIFAWYYLLGTGGGACGIITSGWVIHHLQSRDGWDTVQAYRAVYFIYAGLGLCKLAVALLLSAECELVSETKREPVESVEGVAAEVEPSGPREPTAITQNSPEPTETSALLGNGGVETPDRQAKMTTVPQDDTLDGDNEKKSRFWSIVPSISPESRVIVLQLCLLFGLDSFASGLVPGSWVTYFFSQKFRLDPGRLGSLFSVTSLIAATSNLVAASVARRIGLIQTMVFTHLPSAILLALIPLPSTVGPAMAILLARSCIQSMDTAPRSAFLAAVVNPHERTAVMGLINVSKTLAQSLGPLITGTLAGSGRFWVAFVVAGTLKASYDLSVLAMFRGHRTKGEVQEQRERERESEEREEGEEAEEDGEQAEAGRD